MWGRTVSGVEGKKGDVSQDARGLVTRRDLWTAAVIVHNPPVSKTGIPYRFMKKHGSEILAIHYPIQAT
jgi:hypothetical protein